MYWGHTQVTLYIIESAYPVFRRSIEVLPNLPNVTVGYQSRVELTLPHLVQRPEVKQQCYSTLTLLIVHTQYSGGICEVCETFQNWGRR